MDYKKEISRLETLVRDLDSKIYDLQEEILQLTNDLEIAEKQRTHIADMISHLEDKL